MEGCGRLDYIYYRFQAVNTVDRSDTNQMMKSKTQTWIYCIGYHHHPYQIVTFVAHVTLLTDFKLMLASLIWRRLGASPREILSPVFLDMITMKSNSTTLLCDYLILVDCCQTKWSDSNCSYRRVTAFIALADVALAAYNTSSFSRLHSRTHRFVSVRERAVYRWASVGTRKRHIPASQKRRQ